MVEEMNYKWRDRNYIALLGIGLMSIIFIDPTRVIGFNLMLLGVIFLLVYITLYSERDPWED